MRRSVIAAVLLALPAVPAAAQTISTPVYMAPYRAFSRSELGAAFSDPGAGWALEGAYRYGSGKYDLGARLGIWDVNSGQESDTRFLAGVDMRFRVLDHTENFPLDGSLTLGLGGYLGDSSQGFIPIGLSLGRRVELEGGTSFVPYIQPVLTPTFGDAGGDLLVSLGLGVDFKVSKSFDIRVSGGIGDLDGIAIGFAWIH